MKKIKSVVEYDNYVSMRQKEMESNLEKFHEK